MPFMKTAFRMNFKQFYSSFSRRLASSTEWRCWWWVRFIKDVQDDMQSLMMNELIEEEREKPAKDKVNEMTGAEALDYL